MCGVCKRVQVCALVHVDVQVCVCRRVLCKHVQTACAAAARADVFADMCSHVQAFVCDVVKRVQTCVQCMWACMCCCVCRNLKLLESSWAPGFILTLFPFNAS